MIPTKIALVPGRPPSIEIRSDYSQREACKSVPSGRWSPIRKCWTYPATPAVAQAIVRAFPDADISPLSTLIAVSERSQAERREVTTQLTDELSKRGLWRHQIEAVAFALPRAASMFSMDMGTGKSRCVVEVIGMKRVKRVLIVCPSSVIGVWPSQFRQFANYPVKAIPMNQSLSVLKRTFEAERELGLASARNEVGVVIVNYEAAYRPEFVDWAERQGFDLMVLDESHRIKSPSGITSRTVYKLGASIPNRLCLTGTMMPHGPLDIYSQFRFLDVGVFGGSFVKFRSRYAVMGGYGNHQIQRYQNMDELTSILSRNCFKAGKDLLDLPPETDVTHYCKLSQEALRVYNDLEKQFVADLESGRVTAANVLTRLLRLQQATSGYTRGDNQEVETDLGDDKQRLLADLCDDIPKAEKLVIFCHFIHDLNSIRSVLEASGRRVGEVSGRMKDLTPDAKFPPNLDALVVQQQSGGLGIDLTAARYSIHFSLGFNLGDYLQSRARVHRPGQTKPVTHIHLVAEGTVDERVIRALSERQEVVNSIINQIKQENQ